jgi:hypothetical protein
MRDISGLKRGGPGRPPGVPNKATRELRAFLQGVVQEAISDPECRKRLVERIRTLSIDTKLLQLVLVYGFGRPSSHMDVSVRQPTLEQLIAGTALDDDKSTGDI